MMTQEESGAIRDAVRFYLNPFEALLAAMVEAEGGADAFVKAVQCSRPEVKTFEQAIAVACKTIRSRVLAYQNWPRIDPDGIKNALGTNPLCSVTAVPTVDPWTGEASPHRLTLTELFIRFLAARWAPVGVENDPTNLNANWAGNVIALYSKRSELA
jgi:hypothetical protein